MKRSLFQLVAIACAVGCVATLLWWARSFLQSDLHVGAARGRLVLIFSDGELTRYWMTRGERDEGSPAPVDVAGLWDEVRRGRYITPHALRITKDAAGREVHTSMNAAPRIDSWAGVQVATEARMGARNTYRIIAVPLLYFAALLAIPPILWFVASRRRRRFRAGHCIQCGYDLRASDGRCPECGTPTPPRTMQTSESTPRGNNGPG